MEYSIPKGVFDVLPKEPAAEDAWRASDHWQYLEAVIRKCCSDYGYREIRTPIFERTELFVRGVGDSSDIVTKEMYTFLDKAERSMTLRPEGTAPVMRSFVENRLHQMAGLHKYYYIGPMFRYERPQSGRYRQHHQFGIEAIGLGQPQQDVETIDLVLEIYRRLGLKGLKVMINSVGDADSRGPYREALVSYLEPHFDQLSEESRVRFGKNVLRILDSKDPADQKLLEKAPSILDFLSADAKQHFYEVQKLLLKMKISFEVNHKLVRGLDYYNKTVFEIVSSELGAQNSIGGGGRYDGLCALLGGPDLPAFGYASGLERILQTMTKQQAHFPKSPHPLVFLVPMGDAAYSYCYELLFELRHRKIPAEMDFSGKKMQHGLQLANAQQAEYCIVIGDQELSSGKVELKKMATRETQKIDLLEIVECLTTAARTPAEN